MKSKVQARNEEIIFRGVYQHAASLDNRRLQDLINKLVESNHVNIEHQLKLNAARLVQQHRRERAR